MDSPSEILYWTLRQGQRLDIAEKFGAARVGDRKRFPSDHIRSAVWLQRLRRRGSLAQALDMAARFHRQELRQIEETLREHPVWHWALDDDPIDRRNAFNRRTEDLRSELEHYRDQQYRLLAYAEAAPWPSPVTSAMR